MAIDRDVLLYRSYCGLKQYNVVLDEVADDAPTPMLAVKLLANFLNAGPEDHEVIMLQLKEWQGDPSHGNNPAPPLFSPQTPPAASLPLLRFLRSCLKFRLEVGRLRPPLGHPGRGQMARRKRARSASRAVS